jgi:hypothetical protein
MGGLIGCGGDGSNPTTIDNEVPVSGGLPQSQSQSTATVPASTEDQPVTLANGLTAETPPTTTSVPTTVAGAVLPENVPIIQGVTAGDALSRAPGDLIINGYRMRNVRVLNNFVLSRRLILFPGRYDIIVDGPWRVINGTRVLNVGSWRFVIDVNANGRTNLPTSLGGIIPANGGTTRDGRSFVSFSVPNDFANGRAALTIFKSNGNLSKSITLSGSSGTFADLATNANPVIPTSGVTRVQYVFNP